MIVIQSCFADIHRVIMRCRQAPAFQYHYDTGPIKFVIMVSCLFDIFIVSTFISSHARVQLISAFVYAHSQDSESPSVSYTSIGGDFCFKYREVFEGYLKDCV